MSDVKELRTVHQILQDELLAIHSMDNQIINFINAYIGCFHVGEAARVTGIKASSGVRILNKPDVQRALRAISELSGRKANFDATEILERTNEIAQYDPIDIFNNDGTVKDIEKIPAAVRRAIKKIVVREIIETDMNGMSTTTGFIKTVEFYDKLKGLEMIGKFDGVFKNEMTVTHEIGANASSVLLSSERRALRTVEPLVQVTHDE